MKPALFITLAIAGAIAVATLSPAGQSAAPLALTDKQLHALAFALLIFPLAFSNLRRALWAAPLCLAFGALIELIQPTVGRTAEWADLAADSLGIGIGLLLGWALTRRRSRA